MPEHKGFRLPSGSRVPTGWVAASVVVHLIAVGVLLRMYRGFIFGESAPPPVVAIALPPMRAGAPPRTLPPPAAAPRGAQIVVPPTVVSDIPAPAATAVQPGSGSKDSGVAGGVPGGHGIALRPGQGDPRLWVRPMYIPEDGGRAIDMDSVTRQRLLYMARLSDSIMANDSLSPLRARGAPTANWTFQRNGRTYGLDSTGIHFGTFTIPTAVLAFLPIPQGNIDQSRAYNRMMDMRSDILRAAARAEAEDDFRRAVASIRARKDRERQEQRRKQDEERRKNDQPLP